MYAQSLPGWLVADSACGVYPWSRPQTSGTNKVGL